MNTPTGDNDMSADRPDRGSPLGDAEILAIAREVEAHDFERIAPPPQVWNNILAEFEVQVASQEAAARRQAPARPPTSWFSSARLLSAAAVTLLLVGIAVAAVAYRGDDTPVTQVAQASMTDAGLPVSTNETADARVVCDANTCFVDVDLSALPDAGADDLELWVINEDVTDMYSLGNLTSSNGRYVLPDGVTADDFPIVDISVEPNDGDETHSGQSVLRGSFTQG